MKGLIKAFEPLRKFVGRDWYIPLIALFSALDAFLLIIPIETLTVPAILIKPRRWFWATLWITTGSALGALALAMVVRWDREFITGHVFQNLFHSKDWHRAEMFMDRHGRWALGAIAAGPLPQQPAVAIAGLARMPLLEIAACVWVGRFLKYGVICWLASHAPRIFGAAFVPKEGSPK